MRDLLDIINILSEGGMTASEITRYETRFDKFIDYIQTGKPFTTTDGQEVILDPSEADRFIEMYNDNKFKGAITAATSDGGKITLGKIAKTKDFGGAAVAAGEEASSAGKEALLVKPKTIGITDKEIPAKKVASEIQKNEVLASTDYGQVIIDLSKQISKGNNPKLPKEYTQKDTQSIRKAIVDYAGEYLGVQALINDVGSFNKKDEFLEWLGTDLQSLVIVFPGKSNTNIADSYASITNKNTNHTLNISSKGTGGGAAPAISGLKIPAGMKSKKRKLSNAIKFIEICQEKGVINQAFTAIDFIFNINPNSINKIWHKYLPFSSKFPGIINRVVTSIDSKGGEDPGLPAKFTSIIDTVKGKGTDGGKLVYGIRKEVANAINNNDAIPEFQAAVLEILEMNFIQQYADYKNGEIIFDTQWPAKLDGKISIENKSSSNAPTSGGFSFKLGRTDESVSSEPNEPRSSKRKSTPDFIDAAKSIATGKSNKTTPNSMPTGDVGRAKRK